MGEIAQKIHLKKDNGVYTYYYLITYLKDRNISFYNEFAS